MAFTDAPDVRKIANRYIHKHHPHLEGARIEYVFTDKTPIKGGKEVWGKTQKVSGLAAHLATTGAAYDAEDFFCVIISVEVWQRLRSEQREALVDHELCHMMFSDESDRIELRGHEIEEFNEILDRHGLWSQDVEVFAATVTAQMNLPLTTSAQDGKQADAKSFTKATLTRAGDKLPIISIDTDKRCSGSGCNEMGATQSGLCLKCVGKKVSKKIKNSSARAVRT